MAEFVVVIPSRYASTRLPGKPLREINGKTMLEHVHERAKESAAREVVIATDDERIADAAEDFGGQVCMTGDQHRSGTERIAEVCDLLDWPDETIVVNLQGDEPTMPAALINQCAALLADSAADISTLASPIASQEDFENPNVVKVVVADSASYDLDAWQTVVSSFADMSREHQEPFAGQLVSTLVQRFEDRGCGPVEAGNWLRAWHTVATQVPLNSDPISVALRKWMVKPTI